MSFRVAVVGVGRMGKLHARIISEMPDAELVCVVDTNPATARAVAKQRDCEALTNIADAVERVDAAIIATPTTMHVETAWPFVAARKAPNVSIPPFRPSGNITFSRNSSRPTASAPIRSAPPTWASFLT